MGWSFYHPPCCRTQALDRQGTGPNDSDNGSDSKYPPAGLPGRPTKAEPLHGLAREHTGDHPAREAGGPDSDPTTALEDHECRHCHSYQQASDKRYRTERRSVP